MTRPVPMIDDLPLEAVTWARQVTRPRVVGVPVIGLDGDVQQRLGRGSHEVDLAGILVGAGARDALTRLQQKASSGEEVVFTADITSVLELEKAVIVEATFEESAGRPGRWEYYLKLRESPPLPEPAELSPFGGLDGVDLGFDTDVLGDIADAAGKIQDAADLVTEALSALDALAALGDLSLGNPVEPMQREISRLAQAGAGADAASAGAALARLLGGAD